MFLYNY